MSPEIYREMAQLEDSHWWFVARRTILRNALKSLRLPENSQILEIGCGTGGNLVMLREFGAVTAVEMDDYAREQAQLHCDERILTGYLPNHMPELQKYDLVCLFDVLEHVPDDSSTLKYLHCLVKPGGYLVLTVPAYQWLWSQHDETHHHQRRYHANKLRNLACQAGWRVKRIGYFNIWLLPLIASYRIILKIVPRNTCKTNIKLPPRWINNILKAIFESEAQWLGHHTFPCGISILGILESE